MNDKVLVKLDVPELDKSYELFVPVNEIIWKIEKIICSSLFELTDGCFPSNANAILMNKKNGYIYKENEILFDTDIRNTAELVLIILT